MRRHSLRALMALILLAALGVAALRKADEVWAGIMLLAALAAVGASVLGAAIMRGREQCWWLGFAVFSGGYLALTVLPGVSAGIGPRLPTTMALGFAHSQAVSGGPLPQVLWWQHAQVSTRLERLKAANRGPGDPEFDSAMRMLANLGAQLPGAANRDDFIRVGHCLCALLAGLMGGMIAGRFSARRDRAEGAGHD